MRVGRGLFITWSRVVRKTAVITEPTMRLSARLEGYPMVRGCVDFIWNISEEACFSSPRDKGASAFCDADTSSETAMLVACDVADGRDTIA